MKEATDKSEWRTKEPRSRLGRERKKTKDPDPDWDENEKKNEGAPISIGTRTKKKKRRMPDLDWDESEKKKKDPQSWLGRERNKKTERAPIRMRAKKKPKEPRLGREGKIQRTPNFRFLHDGALDLLEDIVCMCVKEFLYHCWYPIHKHFTVNRIQSRHK